MLARCAPSVGAGSPVQDVEASQFSSVRPCRAAEPPKREKQVWWSTWAEQEAAGESWLLCGHTRTRSHAQLLRQVSLRRLIEIHSTLINHSHAHKGPLPHSVTVINTHIRTCMWQMLRLCWGRRLGESLACDLHYWLQPEGLSWAFIAAQPRPEESAVLKGGGHEKPGQRSDRASPLWARVDDAAGLTSWCPFLTDTSGVWLSAACLTTSSHTVMPALTPL